MLILVEEIEALEGEIRHLSSTAPRTTGGPAGGASSSSPSSRVSTAPPFYGCRTIEQKKSLHEQRTHTAIGTALRHLTDERCSVRIGAIQTLGKVARICNGEMKGRAKVIAAVSDHLRDEDSLVRTAAIKALAQLAEKGNVEVLAALEKIGFTDKEPLVRRTVVEALAKLAQKGGVEVYAAISKIGLADESLHRKVAAVFIQLSAGLHEDSAGVIVALSDLFADENYSVRLGAVKVLAQLAEGGTAGTLASISRYLADKNTTIRLRVIDFLVQRAAVEVDTTEVITATVDLLVANGSESVRMAAVTVLARIPDKEEMIARIISERLQNEDCRVRDEAIQALTRCWPDQVNEVDDFWSSLKLNICETARILLTLEHTRTALAQQEQTF